MFKPTPPALTANQILLGESFMRSAEIHKFSQFTDLQLLDELLRRAQARLRANINPHTAQALVDALRGAKTFLLTLADAEADRADR